MSASPDVPAQVMNTKPLFKLMVERKASDLFFTSNAPIKIKIEGQIYPINKQVLPPAAVRSVCFGLMTPQQIETLQRELEIDFAISEPGLGRFRVNIFYQRGYPAMVLRYITADMPRLESLGLPDTLTELAMLKRGESTFAIGQALRIWPREAQPKFVDAVKELGENGRKRALDLLAQIDYQTKTGVGDAAENIERFLLSLSV